MKVFVNKISGTKWYAQDNMVSEGDDSWYIKCANVSLPKREWEETKTTEI